MITLQPDHQKLSIDCQKAKVCIALLPIIDVMTHWNLTLELLEQTYRLREFTREWLHNPKYREYWSLFATPDGWTILKYVIELLRPIRYSNLWMSNRHTVTLHYVMTVYNDMFDHIAGAMRDLANKMTQWKEKLFLAVKSARQKLCKYDAEVNSSKGKILISAHILNSFRKLRSCRKVDRGMDIHPGNKTSYTTHYQEAFLKDVENEYCAKPRWVQVIEPESVASSKLVLSAKVSGSGSSSCDPYDLFSNDEEYLTPDNVAETTPRRSDHAACFLVTARLHLKSPSEAPKNWGQIDPNPNDYPTNPIESRSTIWLPDITDWLRQPEVMHTKYTEISPVTCAILSIIPHGVRVEATFPLCRDVIGWKQWKPPGETHSEQGVLRQFARANGEIIAGAEPELDTTNTENDSERTLHRLGHVYDVLEMWQRSQILCATKKESCAQNKQMTAIPCILDTKEIVKASWPDVQHDCAAAFKLPKRSHLPQSLSAKDLTGGRTQTLNVGRIWRITHHPVESNEDSSPESISVTKDWLDWNGDMDYPNDTEDNYAAEVESDMEQGNSLEDAEYPLQRYVSTATNVPGLNWPTRKWKRHAEKVLVTVHQIETRRNKGVKQK